MPNQSKKELIQQALAAQELLSRWDNEKIRFYLPCCTVHSARKPDTWPSDKPWFPTKCPVVPCPESKHTKFHLSRARNRVVFGGNRSSKTYSCQKEAIFRSCMTRHPFTGEKFRDGDRHGRVLAQDYGLHEKKHLPDMYDWIPTSALAYGREATKRMAWDKSYDSRNHILHLVKDSWIDFQTYEQDSSKGESVDLDWWWADEEIPEDWYSACNARIVTRQGIGIMGVTPLYRLTWAMRLLDSVNPNVDVFKWGIRDNPHNSLKAIDDFLADVPPLEREARENGDFIEFKGLRYKDINPEYHLIDAKQPDPYFPVIMSMDPHQRKGTAIVWAFVDPHGTIVFFDELLIQGSPNQVVAAIREKERCHKAATSLRIADPAINKQIAGFGSQRTTLNEFEDCGMGFTLADNNESGYYVVEEYLHHDKTKPLNSYNRPLVYFTKEVPMTWYSMTHLRWDEYKFGHDRDPKERVKDKDKDFADNVRYVLAMRPNSRVFSPEPVDLRFEVPS